MSAAASSNPPAAPKLPFPLQDGEGVLTICRRHWIYLWPLIGLQLLAAIVPVAVVAWLLDQVDGLDGTPGKIFLIIAAIYLVYWLVRLLLTWYRFHNDIWVITNQRLIDSHRRSPFDMNISTADLVNVQDMSVQRTGILRTMLDFGNIVCQTASGDQDFNITGIPNPRAVQALVDRERDRERNRLRGI
jgi:hypothetical protein